MGGRIKAPYGGKGFYENYGKYIHEFVKFMGLGWALCSHCFYYLACTTSYSYINVLVYVISQDLE